MCTSPIQIRRFHPATKHSSYYTVPCGHCEECRSKYQNEFACLATLAAVQEGSLHFFTFTYNDRSVPVLSSYFLRGDCYKQSFSRGMTVDLLSDSHQCQPYFVGSPDEGVVHCPSLCREDIKLCFKSFREKMKRELGERLCFKLAFFGEYGDRRYRPHYHGLCFGLSDLHASALADIWRKRFGFVDCKPIPFLNSDGSPGFVKVAKYVSKYLAKRDLLPAFVRQGFAEAPRRQSSIGLGVQFSDIELDRLKNFILRPTGMPTALI